MTTLEYLKLTSWFKCNNYIHIKDKDNNNENTFGVIINNSTGLTRYWENNILKFEYFIINNKIEGECKRWDNNGIRITSIFYSKSKLIKR